MEGYTVYVPMFTVDRRISHTMIYFLLVKCLVNFGSYEIFSIISKFKIVEEVELRNT